MSLYADYVQELMGNHVVESPDGFATYRFTDEHTVYIMDIYIVPSARNRGLSKDVADQIVEIAKKRGCTRLLGSVIPSAKGSTESVKVLLAYGMVLDSSTTDFIVFRKDI